jgi:hypothetical protein
MELRGGRGLIIKKYVFGAAAKGSRQQTHVHEVQGMTESALDHSHRFSGATGEVIPLEGGGHKHEYRAITDYVNGHYHKIYVQTGPGIAVSDDDHVHHAQGSTTVDREHKHDFDLTTFQAP